LCHNLRTSYGPRGAHKGQKYTLDRMNYYTSYFNSLV